jgi:uncharacterized protein (TIGR02757 family)
MRMNDKPKDLRAFLERKTAEYNRSSFVAGDPISIPHAFSKPQDIEIAAFFTAIFSWGNRTTIIRKSQELMTLMDHAPYQFVRQHTDHDLKRLLNFRHRTFNATDLLYFIAFFHHHFDRYDSLEDAFLLPWEKAGPQTDGWQAEQALSAFYHYFFSLDDVPPRTRKHIASPEKHSSCKRINMFLRWMARTDHQGVDFGLWRRIPPARLICPLDLHVARVARRFGLLTRTQSDWLAALELTGHLRQLDPADPTKYDFALFGLGSIEKF